MSISVNGQSQVPPGFRFHPTEEELLHYYLNKKISSHPIDLDVIQDLDLNKIEPWDIQDKCRIGSTPQNDWYFFSHKDKKYPTGTRTNRATASGFWKATGRDKVIYGGSRRIGMRKTLVFYTGRAPHGLKSDWIMHEYRLDNNGSVACDAIHHCSSNEEAGWVVCRVFRKNNHGADKPHDGSRKAFAAASSRCGVPAAPHNSLADERFLKLPSLLESYQPDPPTTHEEEENGDDHDQGGLGLVRGWAALDRLVACHLNCQPVSGAKLQVPSAVARQVHEEHSGSNLWVGDNIREGEADDELLFDGGDGLIWSFAAACSDDNLGNMPAQNM